MMHRRMQQSDAKPVRSLAFSVALHTSIVLVMVGTVNFMPKSTVSFANPNQAINAVFIDAQSMADRQRQQAQAIAQQQEQERQRQQRIQQQERDRQQQIELEAQRKREQEQAQEREREQERQRTLEEQRAREQELARVQELERQRREEFERQLSEQLAQEQQALSAANRGRVMSEVEKYQALVHQTIVQNLFDFESFVGSTCRLNVRLAPSGLVIDVRILDGNDALCRASQAAVLRPDTLPVSDDPDVFAEFRDFNITVRPEIE